MFVIDMIDMPPDIAPIVMAAESGQGKNNADEQERSMGLCYVVGKRAEENLRLQSGVDPWFFVSEYFREFEKRDIVFPYGTEGPHDEVSFTFLQQPSNGTLIKSESSGKYSIYYYQANKGFHGKDKAAILGEVNGHKVKIQIYFHVVKTRTFNMDEVCADTGYIWKISQYLEGLLPDMEGFEPWLDITFGDIASSALAEATSEGSNALITIDTNAYDHGWYIDLTLGQNEEFLPTSDPYEWIVIAGHNWKFNT